MTAAQIAVPTYSDLQKRFDRSERIARLVALAEAVVLCGALTTIRPAFLAANVLGTVLVLGISSGSILLGLLRLLAEHKHSVADLDPKRTFGKFTGLEIQEIVAECFAQAGISPQKARAYLSPDRTANAKAIRLGLGRYLPALDAVYINRSLLNYLTRNELEAVIGHELGHITTYHNGWMAYHLLHAATVAGLSLLLYQILGGGLDLELMAVVVLAGLLHGAVGWARGRGSHDLEFLCDLEGARIAGRHAALSELVKTARRVEVETALQCAAMEAKISGVPLSWNDLQQEVQGILALDSDQLAALEKDYARAVAELSKRRQKSGLTDFARFLWGYDSYETLADLDQEHAKLKRLLAEDATLDELEYDEQGLVALPTIERIVRRIQSQPDRPVFRIPGEANDAANSHPSHARRLFFLWQHA